MYKNEKGWKLKGLENTSCETENKSCCHHKNVQVDIKVKLTKKQKGKY